MVFPDVAHGKVYLKRWNLQAGAADFLEFGPVETVAENATVPEYVCLQTYQEDMAALRKELAGIKKVIISDE